MSPLEKAAQELEKEKAAVEAAKASVETGKDGMAQGKEVGAAKKEEKKLTVWQKVKHGVQHFWDGTKLLGVEIKISWKLAVKMAAGYELSRRERRQVRDIFQTLNWGRKANGGHTYSWSAR